MIDASGPNRSDDSADPTDLAEDGAEGTPSEDATTEPGEPEAEVMGQSGHA
ncbi:MAG: hypothetical protein Q4P32_00130 [Micrococcales bacterium]|nr:hypothetical protein [Micrococcales bacterium]